jgi:hypothetical protein
VWPTCSVRTRKRQYVRVSGYSWERATHACARQRGLRRLWRFVEQLSSRYQSKRMQEGLCSYGFLLRVPCTSERPRLQGGHEDRLHIRQEFRGLGRANTFQGSVSTSRHGHATIRKYVFSACPKTTDLTALYNQII